MGLLTITPERPERGAVELGSTVRVRDAEGEDVYTLVTSAEAKAALGLISQHSPVGRAILGRSPGDEVEVATPGGLRRLTIVDVAPGVAPWDGRSSDPCAP